MSKPFVSIVIPTHNRAHLLPRALNSVLSQSFEDWELVVVDDGSTDETKIILEDWLNTYKPAQTVRLIRNDSPRGVSAARNQALQASFAPWVAFLDSDDEWTQNKLDLQIELSEEYPLVHGEEIWIRKGIRVNAAKKHEKGGGRQFSRCVDLCCISPSAAFVQRDLLKKIGGFREDFPVCEDYDLWLKICAEHEVGFVTTPIVIKYGGHPDQLSTRFKAMDYYRVKALLPFLRSAALSEAEQEHVAKSILQRCGILLKGYEKHSQTANVSEVEAWQEQAKLSFPELSTMA